MTTKAGLIPVSAQAYRTHHADFLLRNKYIDIAFQRT
jgi:hypothetical protein